MSEPHLQPETKTAGVRVALTSSRGTKVDLHFGHADRFLVFGLDAQQATFLGTRNLPGEEDETGDPHADLERAVERIGDCGAVLAMRVGPYARDLLGRKGIRCLEFDGPVLEGLAQVRDLMILCETNGAEP